MAVIAIVAEMVVNLAIVVVIIIITMKDSSNAQITMHFILFIKQ